MAGFWVINARFSRNSRKFRVLQRRPHHIWLPHVVCRWILQHMVVLTPAILFLSHALIHKHSVNWLSGVGKALEIKEICINAGSYESARPVGEIRQ